MTAGRLAMAIRKTPESAALQEGATDAGGAGGASVRSAVRPATR
jgi:hypothetical protein